ncbi:MAG: hypothetical protein V1787_03565 [Candidatus Micrarchaeota archaeon]
MPEEAAREFIGELRDRMRRRSWKLVSLHGNEVHAPPEAFHWQDLPQGIKVAAGLGLIQKKFLENHNDARYRRGLPKDIRGHAKECTIEGIKKIVRG